MVFKTSKTIPGAVLTVNEVADYLRVHRSTIYRLIKNNQIPAFRVGSDWRFSEKAIAEWQRKSVQVYQSEKL